MPKQNSYSTRGVYVNTTDATQTTAATFSTKTNKAYGVVAKITATETADFDEQAFYIRTGLFKNDGGTLALVGSVGTPTTIESTAGWDVTLDASGTDIRVRVTGAASTVATWMVELEVSECGKYVAESGIIE
jgi:hypothetical protein